MRLATEQIAVQRNTNHGATQMNKPTDTLATAAQRIAALEAELKVQQELNTLLNKKSNATITMKVSDKGAVSVYGLGRFPVSLYTESKDGTGGKGQWDRLLDSAEAIKAFIEANRPLIRERLAAARAATAEPVVASPPASAAPSKAIVTGVVVKRFNGKGDAL